MLKIEETKNALAAMYDPEIRRLYRQAPIAAMDELRARGYDTPELRGDEEYNVVSNTTDKMYVVLPKIEDNHSLSNEDLARIQAAGQAASTVACASTFGTAMCVSTTFSTASTAGTIGTAGSAA